MPADGATAPGIVLGPRGLELPLGGKQAYFNYHWLRDADPGNVDPATRERVFDIAAIEGGPTPRAARVEDDALVIDWAAEDSATRVPLRMLEEVVRHGRVPDPADLPRRLWDCMTPSDLVRVSRAGVEEPAGRLRLARALIEDGMALVTEMEDADVALSGLAAALGPVTPTVDGYYFDVRLSIAPTNLAFTARALELHTDLPSEEVAPGVQFLHSRVNTVEGGRTIFVDGAAVADAMRAEDPEGFDLLADHAIPFYRRHDGWDYRSHQRVIEVDGSGAVSGVTVSQHLQDAIDLPQKLLDRYYPALCRFLRMLREPDRAVFLRLEGGTCAVFDNHRIAHGREAFEASSGERHLRGCYVDRGALRSTYRTLLREGGGTS